MIQLTKRQKSVLHYLREHERATGSSPTHAEVMAHFGFESPNAVQKHIQALARKGALTIHRLASGRCQWFSALTGATATVPLLGSIAAGVPLEAIENVRTTLDLSALGIDNSGNEYFALTVKGDSMIDAHIMSGDTVVIKRKPTVGGGDIAAVLWNNEATLKYVKTSPDGSVMLVPANAAMKPMRVTADKTVSFQILGTVVRVIRSY
jgi:repressor LexA